VLGRTKKDHKRLLKVLAKIILFILKNKVYSENLTLVEATLKIP